MLRTTTTLSIIKTLLYIMKYLKKKTPKYLQRIGIAVSVLINVILGGPSNQTFSARNYARKRDNKINIVWLIDFLVFWDKNHCMSSWLFWYTGKNIRKVGLMGKSSVYSEEYKLYNGLTLNGEYDANFD